MAYEELKAQIREYIKPNEQEEITGAIMQAILLEMVNQLGAEGSYLPLTGGNVTGGIVVSSDLFSPSHEALRLNQSGISVEKIASVGLNEILNVTANSITYSSYFPSETPNILTISLGYTGVTLSGGVTAASFINSSVDASIRYQYLLKADGNVISISDIGGTDMQTVWEALAASTNEQINVSHLSTALNGYIHPTLSNLSNGDILVYDSVGTWVNTSMSSFLSGYATETWVNTQLASYATQSWVSTNYLNRVSTNSGDIYINDGGSAWVLANLNTLIVGYGYITASALNGYATEAWVGQQGYITSSALNGYATQSWVNQQGFSKFNPTISSPQNRDILVYESGGAGWLNASLDTFLSGYATQNWVQQQGYVTSSGVTSVATGTGLTGGTITGTGTISIVCGFSAWDNNIATWGTLTSANGYTNLLHWSSIDSGDMNFAYKNGQISAQLDGWFYQNEGRYRVLDTSDASSLSVNYATSAGSANILGHSVYENPAHALANGDMLVYDSGTGWTNVETSSILSGYATQSWVTSQGYITSSALNGYATQSWVNQQGFSKFNPTISSPQNRDILVYESGGAGWLNASLDTLLSVYATQSWVNTQLAGYLPLTGGTVTGTTTFNNEIHFLKHISVGYPVDTYNQHRAEVDVITSINDAADIWMGTDSTRQWVINVRPSTENNCFMINCTIGSGEVFTLTTDGKLGLSKTPDYKLDVNGSANATTLYENGSRVITTANIGSQSVNYATIAGSANILGQGVTTQSGHALSNGDILVYDSVGAWVNVPISSFLSGYATQSWVNQQGFSKFNPTISSPQNRDILVYESGGAGWLNASLDTLLSVYATQSWVNTQLAGYLPLTGGTVTGTTTFNNDVHFLKHISVGYPVDTYSQYRAEVDVITSINDAADIWMGTDSTRQWVINVRPSTENNYFRINCTIGSGEVFTLTTDGKLGLSKTPDYKLDVNGSANATTLYENGSRVITTANIGSQSVNHATTAGSANILGHTVSENTSHSLSNGDILIYDSVGTWTNVSSGLSDIRQKDVINYNAEPTFEAVANAPAIRFTYKDARYSFRRGVHVGSIAQYWQTTLPETVSMDNEGMLSMKYDVIALLSTISVAKKVSEHERRIILLERENEQLKKEIEALKSA